MLETQERPKILIVDDIPENLIALQMLLKKIDVEVVKAFSGKEAIEATLHHDFNLILLDVMMPEMDGYQVAEFLHNNDKTAYIPIIFISAMDKNDANESLGYSKGAVDFLFKPINEIILLSKIKIHLELQKKRQFIKHTLGNHPIDPPKILIVDDNPENLFALEKILEKLDVKIVKATSGNEALSTTLYNDFALIILDVKMPGMDGYEVAEILKYDDKTDTIPVIFITVLDEDDEKELKGYETGAVDYIVKPFNSFILISKVRVFIELYKIKSALENLVRERNQDLQEANIHLQLHNQRLRGIVDSINKLTSRNSLQSIGSLILEEFAKHMDATGGSLYLVEDNGLRLLHSVDPNHAITSLDFPLPETSLLKRAIDSNKPILADDLNTLDNINSSGWGGYTSDSILIFPLVENNKKTIAVIALHNKRTPPFTNHDLEIGNILISYVSETLRGTQFQEALLKSEQQYKSLFEKAKDSFFIVDRRSLKIFDANDAALKLTGYGSTSIKNMNFELLIVKAEVNLLEEIHTSETAKDLGQVQLRRKDDNIRTATLSLVPLDEITSICMLKDITSKLEIENQLRQTQKMESLGTLAGGIAHDFNNLLSPILGYSDIILKTVDDDSLLCRNVKEIHTATIRAKDLVKQILTFSHQEKIEFSPIKIQPIVTEAIKLIRSSLPSTINIEQDICKDCGLINADSTLIHQIVMNLSTNSYHAMKENGGKLFIKLANYKITETESFIYNLPANSYVKLSVVDTGIGMTDGIIEKIFDPFFTTKPKEEGTGMGLSVVHGIVNKLGGNIFVDSKSGEGSKFSIFFPYADNQTLNTPKISQFLDTKSKNNEHILFIDDDVKILELTQQTLELAGYQVSVFDDSLSALKDFKKNKTKYDLVITDLTMPNLTGDKLASKILKIEPKIPILILTGFSGNLTEDYINSIGIKAVLDKPVQYDELTGKVRQILNNHSLK